VTFDVDQEALRAIESRLATEFHHAVDRRKVLRVTVTGTQRAQAVELDPRWRRSLQSQRLGGEVTALYRTARESAAEAASAAYDDAGFGWLDRLSGFRTGIEQVPGGPEFMEGMASGSVSAESIRGRVIAEFTYSGELLSLRIHSRHALESRPVELAIDLCAVLRQGESAAAAARAELAARLTGGQTVEGLMREDVENFRSRLGDLTARLP